MFAGGKTAVNFAVAGAFYLVFEIVDRKVIFWRPNDGKR